jgi:hypothetical protein
MRSIIAIVANVLAPEALQERLVQHDDMIKQLSSTVANPAFGHAVLPRAWETGSLRLDAQAFRGTTVSVLNIVARSKIRYLGEES